MKRTSIKRIANAASCAALSLALTASAASFEWDGGAGSAFLNDPANWNPDGLPDPAADTATVTVSGSQSLSLSSNFGAKRLYLTGTAGDSLDLDLNGNTLDTSADRLYIDGLSATIRNGTISGKSVTLGTSTTKTASLSLFNATLALPETNGAWKHDAVEGASLHFSASVATNLPFYTVNTAITAENGSRIGGYLPNATAEGTNFSIVARGGSTVTVRTGTGGAHLGSRIILEDSAFVCSTHYYAGKAGTAGHGNLIAATNSTLQFQTLTFSATNDVIRLHNSALNSSFGINLTGIGNRAYWSGVSTGTSAGLGIGTLFDIAPGSIVTNTSISLAYATNATVRVGEGAAVTLSSLRTIPQNNYGKINVSSGNLVEVREGGTIHIRRGNFTSDVGLNGQTNVVRLLGTMRVDRATHLGVQDASNGCRLELVGDGACYNGGCFIEGATGHMSIGNADNPDSVTILFKPGPTGFGGTAPLITKPSGNIVFTDARIEVDAREFVRASRPDVPLRLPLATSAGSLTADVEALQARTTSLPAGGRLEKEGKTLYWTFTKPRGLTFVVR